MPQVPPGLPRAGVLTLQIEQDLVEEVARIYGYNNLPTSTPSMALELQAKTRARQDWVLPAFRQHLVASGYQEAVTYSFVEPEYSKAG